jgi:hypothetical protein
MFDNANVSRSEVPFISEIPVIGNFFTFSEVRNRKTNLLIFLTPHIIRNERDQRNVSVGERERILQKPFEERALPAPDWEPLRRPSWELRPSLEPEEKKGPAAEEARPQRAPAEAPPPGAAPAAAPALPSGANLYVLLAVIWESGSPPPSLLSSNGLVALAVPADSPLAQRFRKGTSYRFVSESYTANIECLEVFGTAQAAFATYPDGMQVSVQPPSFLHWREPTDPAARALESWVPVS